LKELQDSRLRWEAVEKENERLAEAFSALEKTVQQKNARETIDTESNKRVRNTTPVSSDSSVFGKIKEGEYDVVKWNKLVEKYNNLCIAHNEAVASKKILEETLRRKRAEHDKNLETLTKHIADRDDAIQKKREIIRKLKARLGEAHPGGPDDVEDAAQNPQNVLPEVASEDILSPIKRVAMQIPVSSEKIVATEERVDNTSHQSTSPTTNLPHIFSPPPSEVPHDQDLESVGESQELPNLLGEGRFRVEDTQFEPLEPLPLSSTEDAPSPTLARHAPQEVVEPPSAVPESPDSPVVVSSRSIRKRKRRNEEANPSPPMKVKVEHITSSPIRAAPSRRLEHVESFDLDEIGEKVDTPRKQRQRDILRQATNLSSESQVNIIDTRQAPCSSTNSPLSYQAAPIRQLQAEHRQSASPLRPLDNNQCILPRTSGIVTPRPIRLASDQAVEGLSEDGSIFSRSENAQPKLGATSRLDSLLTKPSPPKKVLSSARRQLDNRVGSSKKSAPSASAYEERNIPTPELSRPLSVKGRGVGKSTESPKVTKALPSSETRIRSASAERIGALTTNDSLYLKVEDTNDTPNSKTSVTTYQNTATSKVNSKNATESTPGAGFRSRQRPPRPSAKKQRVTRAEDDDMNPENEPLRTRPLETLSIGDFKVNPNANQGIAYAFKDVVRGREQRRCLQGCTKPECCGNELRNLVLMMRDNPRTDQDIEDQQLLEDFMGDNAYKIRNMNPSEREEAIIQAMTRDLANKYGRHRHAYQRKQSPPGFWDADFPLTQEQQELRRMEEEKKQEAVRMRYEEAMRPGGAYIFRDEH
jgi:hypothetical protein